MAKINGTAVLLYIDGTLVACQKGATVNIEQDLPDASCKDDGGWETHINGIRRASIDLDALYSTTGLSAEALIADITGRSNVLAVVSGAGFPIVMEADLQSTSMTVDMENPAAVTGTLIAQGAAYMLTGDYAALITIWESDTYDTFTSTGTAIASAITAAGDKALSDEIDITDEDVVKVFVFLTLNSGQVPSISIDDGSGTNDISNVEALAAGVNVVTLTATATDSTSVIKLENTAAANFATSAFYVFKV